MNKRLETFKLLPLKKKKERKESSLSPQYTHKVGKDLKAKGLHESVNQKSFDLVRMNLLDYELGKRGHTLSSLVTCYSKMPRIEWN